MRLIRTVAVCVESFARRDAAIRDAYAVLAWGVELVSCHVSDPPHGTELPRGWPWTARSSSCPASGAPPASPSLRAGVDGDGCRRQGAREATEGFEVPVALQTCYWTGGAVRLVGLVPSA